MNTKEVIAQLEEKPFLPFAALTTDGRRYEVKHPENARVAESGLLLIFQPSEDPEAQIQRPVTLSLLHVTNLEPIREAAA